MMRFRAKSLLFLCVLMSISLFGINVRAANPADFRAIYTPYINQHDEAFVIDLDNDGVPELLGLDLEDMGHFVCATFYKINEYGSVIQSLASDACIAFDGGIDGAGYTAFYGDDFGRIYTSTVNSQYYFPDVGFGGWKYSAELFYYTGNVRQLVARNENKHIFEYDYNSVTWDEYLAEQNFYMNPDCYTKTHGLKNILSVVGESMWTDSKPLTFVGEDPWSTWISPGVVINGNLVRFADAKPYIKNGRTMIPVRMVSEILGATVSWDDKTRTVVINKGNIESVIGIESNVMYVNGQACYIDAVAEITYDRTYVPLRAISEALNAVVEWDGSNKVVYIAS